MSASTQDIPLPANSEKWKFTYQNNWKTSHFFLILQAGHNYTREEIERCEGKRKCFNCHGPIMDRIYFYPMQQNKLQQFYVNPLPHCRAECAKASVVKIPNNHLFLHLFTLMYGDEVDAAPPRELLYVPGGVTLEEYHQMVDDGLVVCLEQANPNRVFEPLKRTFLAPMFVSVSLKQGHQVAPNFVKATDAAYYQDEKSTLGPKDAGSSNLDGFVSGLPSLPLSSSRIGQVFAPDPNYSVDLS